MAKITTITNPLTGQPAQVDQLDHTAQQIDDSVKRALEYGLGAISKNLTSDDDIDTIFQNGWYRWGGSAPKNAPITGFDRNNSLNLNSYTLMRVSNWGSNDVIQEFWNLNNNMSYKSQRIIRNGVVNPIEWVNAPMFLREEYRTTERYLGNPVYCMTKFVGEVAANTVTQVIFTDSDIGKYCIRAFCTGKRTFSNWEDDTTSMVSSPAGSGTIITCDPTVYRLNEGYRGIRAYIKSSASLKDVYCTAYYTKWAD